jgi:hypothetical protein
MGGIDGRELQERRYFGGRQEQSLRQIVIWMLGEVKTLWRWRYVWWKKKGGLMTRGSRPSEDWGYFTITV